MKKRLILLIFVIFVFIQSIHSQTISTSTVFWTTGWCNICGPTTGNYACETGSGSGNWNNGVRTFADPVPPGHTVCAVSVQVNKVDCGLTNLCVLLNGTAVGACQAPTIGSNCSCGACWPQTFSQTTCPFPNYVYGGINTLDLNPVGNLCVSNAIITIYSNSNCVGPCIVPLPIELLYFRADYHNNEILTSWYVVSEINNDYYTVEKGKEIKNEIKWETIGTIDNSKKNKYEFIDTEINDKTLTYYRLRQTDYDGTYSYSQYVKVNPNIKQKINVYPNPANNELTIEGLNTDTKIEIMDYTQKYMDVHLISSLKHEQIIDLSTFNEGMYILMIKSSSYETVYVKFNVSHH